MNTKARVLAPGDGIGIITPSWCGPSKYPHRVQGGVNFLKSLGYRVVVAENAYGARGVVSGTPEERVADIHQMFGDDSIRAIIATIGGGHSCHLLPLLDW